MVAMFDRQEQETADDREPIAPGDYHLYTV